MSLILWCPDQTLCRCQTSSFSLSRFWPVCCCFFFFLLCLSTEKRRVRQAARPRIQSAKLPDALIQDGPPRASMDPQLLGAKAGFTDTVSALLARDIYTICLHAAQHSFFPPSLSLLLSLLTYAIWWARSLQCSQRIRLLEREGFPSESRTSNPASEPSSCACHQPILLYVSAARWNYVNINWFIYQTSSSTCSPGLRFLNLRIVI